MTQELLKKKVTECLRNIQSDIDEKLPMDEIYTKFVQYLNELRANIKKYGVIKMDDTEFKKWIKECVHFEDSKHQKWFEECVCKIKHTAESNLPVNEKTLMIQLYILRMNRNLYSYEMLKC